MLDHLVPTTGAHQRRPGVKLKKTFFFIVTDTAKMLNELFVLGKPFQPWPNAIKLFTPVIFNVCSKLACLSLGGLSSLVKSLWVWPGAYR